MWSVIFGMIACLAVVLAVGYALYRVGAHNWRDDDNWTQRRGGF